MEKGHAPSALRLGEEYFYGNPVYPPDCRKGKDYLVRAVELGVAESGKKLIKAYSHAVGTRAINPCAGDMGADMDSLAEVKKFLILNGLVEPNPRVLSAYYALGFDILNEHLNAGNIQDLFTEYSTDEILEMLVFLFAKIEYLHQIGGAYRGVDQPMRTLFRAKIFLNRLVLENCGWIDSPFIDRGILEQFDFSLVMGKTDYRDYKPIMTGEMQSFCGRVGRFLEQRAQLSEAKNHDAYYGFLTPRDVLVHLKEYVSEPKF